MGLLVMALMGLNWSSDGSDGFDSDFFWMGLTVGFCVCVCVCFFFFFFGADSRLWVTGGGGIKCV